MTRKVEPYMGIADIYEEIRPSYPEELIDDVISITDLKPSASILEIGAGTGKATIQLAYRGYAIHAIESGSDMAKVFEVKCSAYPKVSLEVTPFEEWNNSYGISYDMIFSAQAFHWIDVNIKYKKCHDNLKGNGYLVLFWYAPCDDKSSRTTEIEEKVGKIIEKYTSSSSGTGKLERRVHSGVISEDERKLEIEKSALFSLVEKLEYTHEIRDTADQYLMSLKSTPAFASKLDGLDNHVLKAMDHEIKEVIDMYGGYVGVLFNYSLYIARKL